MAAVDVLIPTLNRPVELAVTLTGVASQGIHDLRVVIADQGEESACNYPAVATVRRLIEARGGKVEWLRREPGHGIAEQRDFLVRHATAPQVLMLDDDILMEPWVLAELSRILSQEDIGFVGAFPAGLSFLADERPEQQRVEFWEGRVEPEAIEPGSKEWDRAKLHGAANTFHVARKVPPGEVRPYKVAWVGACALYDREKLEAIGGFSFWSELPKHHAGEEVLVQNLLLRRWGGCGIIPSGTYHAEAPTNIEESGREPEANAITLLPRMIERYLPDSA